MSKNETETAKAPLAFGKIAAGMIAIATITIGGFLMIQKPISAADIVVYKSPTCGCCKDWVSHMRENGYTVEVHNQTDLSTIKSEMGVPRNMQSCHTAKVDGYVIEGHVPADLIGKMLKEKPSIQGLAVPGMPMGSPGMEGPRKDPYDVLTFNADGKTTIYATR